MKCDFVVQRGMDIEGLYQVTWNMSDEETRRREIAGIVEAAKATGCSNLHIITNDGEEEIWLPEENLTIKVIPVYRWILSV